MHPTALSAARDPASPQTVLEVCWKLPQSVVGTVVTAMVAGVALVLVKLLNDKLRRYLPMPIPGELLTVRTPGGRAGEGGRGGYIPAGGHPWDLETSWTGRQGAFLGMGYDHSRKVPCRYLQDPNNLSTVPKWWCILPRRPLLSTSPEGFASGLPLHPHSGFSTPLTMLAPLP